MAAYQRSTLKSQSRITISYLEGKRHLHLQAKRDPSFKTTKYKNQ